MTSALAFCDQNKHRQNNYFDENSFDLEEISTFEDQTLVSLQITVNGIYGTLIGVQSPDHHFLKTRCSVEEKCVN